MYYNTLFMKHSPVNRAVASLLCGAMLLTSLPAFSVEASETVGDPVLYWNEVILDAIAHDANETYGSALHNNPGATSRILGMFHGAIYDSINSIRRTHEPYLTLVPVRTGTGATDSAVAYAAHGILSAMYPDQQSVFDTALETHMEDVPDSTEKDIGAIVGRIVADAMLNARNSDGSEIDGTYVAGDQPGQHRVDPLNPDQSYWGPTWGEVTPFVLSDGSQFRAPEPPAITSQEYADAYNEVKAVGGDGIITATTRTDEQTEIGTFWAYDGSKMLGTPPRFYNQIARTIIENQNTDVAENARLFALMNLAVADAGIAAWDSKFHYGYWRPVIGIREADVGTGPSGLGDDNPDTEGDPEWTPLNSPASNQSGQDFTPPFPTYPSGHATFGAAAFRTMANYFGTDDIAFTVTSDELNGVTTDTDGNVRPLSPRSFSSLSEAAVENGMSRVYLGIHWNFDASSGIDMGNSIADYAFANYLQPANLPADPCESTCITEESYDLVPSGNAPASVERDSTFEVSFAVTNSGLGVATGATLTVLLPVNLPLNTTPAGCSTQSGSLVCTDITVDGGDTEELYAEFSIPSAHSCPTNVEFIPSVSAGNDKEITDGNNTGAAITVLIECEPEHDLSVSLNGPSEVPLGDIITYSTTVTNDGPASASAPIVSVSLPAGVTFSASHSTAGCGQNGSRIDCALSPLANGTSADLHVAFTPLQTLACGTELETQATLSSVERETNATDNISSTVRTELTCTAAANDDSGSENSGGNTAPPFDPLNRDTVGRSQSPGATRGKGTTEARFVLSLLGKMNGMDMSVARTGHFRLANNTSAMSNLVSVGSDRTVLVNGWSKEERNVICGMKRYMEEQDPRKRKTDEFKDWLVGEIADNLHRDKEHIRDAVESEMFCR